MTSVAIIGKPNCGKSLLFNRLTGLHQKVANFPGVTVELKRGFCGEIEVVDFPGVYSLSPISSDESIAVEKFQAALTSGNARTVVCVLDGTKLTRSLVLALQIKETAAQCGARVIYAINMMDEVTRLGTAIHTEHLAEQLGGEVILISARTSKGLEDLKQAIDKATAAPLAAPPLIISNKETPDTIRLAKELSARCSSLHPASYLGRQNSIDRWFLSGVWGGLLFLLTMLILFQAIFTWSAPFMEALEASLEWLAAITKPLLPPGILQDFVGQALFGGIGAFVVFVPQIFILTMIIGGLEDSGYLARAAIICHKPLSKLGLSGKSFIALLTGHACAIPAVFAARTIESPRRRLLTILVLPLLVCSARLPVYSLLIALVIPDWSFFAGLFGLRGLAFLGCYAFGIVAALLAAVVLERSLPQKEHDDYPFILELPPYRWPSFYSLLQRSTAAAWAFISKAGTIIFMASVTVWVLGYFPDGQLSTSYLSLLGKWLEPVFAPMGSNWKIGVAILASFLAREVFVSTLGILYGIANLEEFTSSTHALLAHDIDLASGLGLLVFYALALQCISTLSVIRREVKNPRIPLYMFLGYTFVAYIAAVSVYQLLRLLV